MTRKTIDYERLGIEACEAFTEGPAAFADFVRTTLSIAAPVHALQIDAWQETAFRLGLVDEADI